MAGTRRGGGGVKGSILAGGREEPGKRVVAEICSVKQI